MSRHSRNMFLCNISLQNLAKICVVFFTVFVVKNECYLAPSRVHLEDMENYIWRGNVSFGIPRQTFKLQFTFRDIFSDVFFVLDEIMSIYGVEMVQKFNRSLSTTFVQEDKEFECIPGAGGPVGMDNISLGDSAESARMEFGVDVISQNRYFVEVDGIIGLAPECYSVCNITLPLRQILSQYEKQVFTFWSYRPELAYEDRHAYTATNGTAIMSFGDVDRENCLDNWVYVPRHGKSKLYIFPIHSLVVNGATFDLKKWNGTISELHGSFIAASVKLVYFMIGATGGVYNKHTRMFHVPCDGKFPNITLNIGVNGTESVILTSKDYVGYYVGQFTNDDLSRKCYLKFTDAKNDWDQDNQLTLSASFLNNHCFSYNLKTDTIGFADSLPPKVNGHTSDGSADGTELDGNSTGTPNVTTTPDTEFLSDNAFHCKMTNDFMLSIVLCGFVALFV